jgi:2-oxoglutarate ferredoxin oxidoreductase subunit delta
MYIIEVTVDLCNGCGSCVDSCPMDVLIIRNDKASPEQSDNCMCCKLCEVECENQAIKVHDSV